MSSLIPETATTMGDPMLSVVNLIVGIVPLLVTLGIVGLILGIFNATIHREGRITIPDRSENSINCTNCGVPISQEETAIFDFDHSNPLCANCYFRRNVGSVGQPKKPEQAMLEPTKKKKQRILRLTD